MNEKTITSDKMKSINVEEDNITQAISNIKDSQNCLIASLQELETIMYPLLLEVEPSPAVPFQEPTGSLVIRNLKEIVQRNVILIEQVKSIISRYQGR